jgi:alpha-L-arabinofuranosidase
VRRGNTLRTFDTTRDATLTLIGDDLRSAEVAILQVDTDRRLGTIDSKIYGQFLEHINHSVEDGLFAEQIRGAGFEGRDFETYWTPFGPPEAVRVVEAQFERGTKSVQITASRQPSGIRQRRVFLESGRSYAGSVWIKIESGAPRVSLRVLAADGNVLADLPLRTRGSAWQEVPFSFANARSDRDAVVELSAGGRGAALVDFVSLAHADVRGRGMLRPDLLAALRGLAPAFIRWPGGSFASTYKWQDGIGPFASRVYHPNELWGGYSDYYGFGTDEYAMR